MSSAGGISHISEDVALNTFARACFVEQADCDYICARAVHRLGMQSQFLWMSQQTLEKYGKAVLLFNRNDKSMPVGHGKKTIRSYGHDLVSIFDAVRGLQIIDVQISNAVVELIARIASFASDRYLTKSWWTKGDERELLDQAVWEIRPYCAPWVDITQRLKSRGHSPTPPIAVNKCPGNPGNVGGILEGLVSENCSQVHEHSRSALLENNRHIFVRSPDTSVDEWKWLGSKTTPLDRDWANDPSLKAAFRRYIDPSIKA